MNRKIIVENSIDNIVTKVAEHFYNLINSSSKQLNISLSGGNTPKLVFKKLVADYLLKVDWERINFWWGDERCVPPDDTQSNFGMTAEYLLDHIVIPKHNIFRIHGESDPGWEAERYGNLINDVLPKVNNIPQYDIIYLGLGEDGHTASIFPDQIDLFHSPNNCVRVKHPDTGQLRVSITGKIINNAKEVILLATGDNKANIVNDIISGEEISKTYPAALVDPKRGNYIWFLDSSVAKLLKNV